MESDNAYGGTTRWAVLVIGTALAVGLLAIGAVAAAALITGLPVGGFTRDVRTLAFEAGADLPAFAGVLSELNLMVWAAAAALAAVAAWLLPPRRSWMLLFGGLLVVLAADDALTLHEGGPNRVIPEPLFFVVYGVAGAVLLAGVARRRDPATVAFVLGGGLLAASVLVDVAVHGQYLLEDGFKLLGSLVWATVAPLALAADRRTVRSGPAHPQIREPRRGAAGLNR